MKLIDRELKKNLFVQPTDTDHSFRSRSLPPLLLNKSNTMQSTFAA